MSNKKRNVAMRKYQRNWIKRGLCARCQKPNKERPGKWYCIACATKAHTLGKPYALDVRIKLREAALMHYGPICNCCGETEKTFLCFDHINDDGATIRRKDRRAYNMPRWLKAHNYPDTIQVLCHNCNYAKTIVSVCPHKQIPGQIYTNIRLTPKKK